MYNKVILIGRLGKDPEIRNLDSGKKVATFTLATDDIQKDKDGKPKTQWHNITMWEGLANTAEQHLKKGALISVEGSISYEKYNDKESGVEKNYTRITAQGFKFLSSKKDAGDSAPVDESSAPASKPAAKPTAKAPAPAAKAPAPAPAMADTEASDDLPF